MQLESPAAALLPGNQHLTPLSGEYPHGGRVDLVEEHVLHTARQQRDPSAAAADGRGEHRQLRERQVAAGRARAALYTWSASAAAHRDVYQSVVTR